MVADEIRFEARHAEQDAAIVYEEEVPDPVAVGLDDILFSDSESDSSVEPDEIEYVENWDEEDDDEEVNRSLSTDLAEWVAMSRTPIIHVNNLLQMMNFHGIEGLPMSCSTLMKTPTTKIIKRSVPPGEYFHFGIQNHIKKNKYPFLENIRECVIDIGIDGLKLFNSSSLSLWPIIGSFVDRPNTSPFIIGCYAGYKQPESSDVYLYDFALEVQKLMRDGIQLSPDRPKTKFSIRLFCCDAPARAFVTCVMYHQGFHGCSKCDQVGKKIGKTTVYRNVVTNIRTDESFSSRIDFLHHNPLYGRTKTVLEKINIQMVSQFPIDPMHLVDEGVVKKMLLAIIKGKCIGYRVNPDLISDRLMLLVKPQIPSEFSRDCRRLTYISYFKATEFKQIICYTGIVVLRNLMNEDIYYHFLLLHCAVRILSCPTLSRIPENVNKADELIQEYVSTYHTIYGANKLVHNVHNLLHLADCVRQFGPLNSFSAYKFECFMQQLKRPIKNGNHVLQQLFNRQSEREALGLNVVITKFGEFNIDPRKAKDSFCCIAPNIAIKVVDIKNEDGVTFLYGHKCMDLNNFYEMPIVSSELGIITYKTLSNDVEKFNRDHCIYKYFNIPLEDSVTFVLVPILHQCFNRF